VPDVDDLITTTEAVFLSGDGSVASAMNVRVRGPDGALSVVSCQAAVVVAVLEVERLVHAGLMRYDLDRTATGTLAERLRALLDEAERRRAHFAEEARVADNAKLEFNRQCNRRLSEADARHDLESKKAAARAVEAALAAREAEYAAREEACKRREAKAEKREAKAAERVAKAEDAARAVEEAAAPAGEAVARASEKVKAARAELRQLDLECVRLEAVARMMSARVAARASGPVRPRCVPFPARKRRG
jgi:chromosome segregation ATPase